LYNRYGNDVAFLCVYVREAHPIDGWRMASNDAAGIEIKQPREQGERDTVARQCCSALGITMPLVVDDLNDLVGHAYSGMPDRLYVIDHEGKVAYKGGRGPFGFKPAEMEQALVMALLARQVETPPGKEAPPKDR
jgi:Iodothyronine deiodinase